MKNNYYIIFVSLIIFIISFILYNYYIMPSKTISAIAVFNNDPIKGTVKFIEELTKDRIRIEINVSGLSANSLHGFHVHEAGDLTDKCTSMCAHFNPYGKIHGCPGVSNRHVGDLGNLETNGQGVAKYVMYDDVIKLRGTKCNIIGRGLIIHEDPDDCGLGNNEESLKTGNAGKRIACAVIGYSKDNFKC
jgi:superoxide dismutase, Cu-Zn family